MSEIDERQILAGDQTSTPGEPDESSGDPLLAIGFPVGWMIAILGTILVLYGLLGSPENERSLGFNINLWWGLFMVAFGTVVLGLSYGLPQRRPASDGRPR